MSAERKMANFEFEGDDFSQLCALLYQHTGIAFDDKKVDYLRKRVATRIDATGGDGSFRQYLRQVKEARTKEELQELVNLVTVNETYFFREVYQLECLVTSMLDEIVAKNPHKRRIRIWSLPCSTGEEPYSLAIYLLERWSKVDSYEIEIIGSDIDTDVLAHAGSGRFSSRSVRLVPEPYLKKYFARIGDEWQLSSDILGSVELTHVNLSDPHQMSAYRDIDVVFCRNVLIYFDDLSRRLAAENIFHALNPGGFVCLGHSESMSRISSLFELRKFPEAMVYQRPYFERK